MTQQEVVIQYFREAELTPSGIDSLLRLPKGRAHDLIVSWWQNRGKGPKELDDTGVAPEPESRVKRT